MDEKGQGDDSKEKHKRHNGTEIHSLFSLKSKYNEDLYRIYLQKWKRPLCDFSSEENRMYFD